MSPRREGIRRLSIAVGMCAGACWILYVFIASEGFSGMDDPVGWVVFFGGMPVAFGLGRGLVLGVAWVVEGFRQDAAR